MGVCFDICYVFVVGYDIVLEKGFLKMMDEFDIVIGFKYLRVVYLNDLKGEIGCYLDRYENIGRGKIGVEVF